MKTILYVKSRKRTRNELVRALAKYIEDPNKLTSAVEQVCQSKELIELYADSERRFSTRELQSLKSSLTFQAQVMAGQNDYGTSERIARTAINKHNRGLQETVGANLSEEQCTAIHHILNGQQLNVVIGLAGSGKSTLLAAVNDAWQQQGRRVIGAALSGKAADGLQSASGIESRTLASWQLSWKNGYHLLQSGDVLVIDEAGMIGTRHMHSFVEQVLQQGAKLVLVGDPEQLQPINAGTPLRELAKQVGSVELTKILRQKKNWQRQATLDFARNRTDKALNAYAAHGAIHRVKSNDDAISTLVEDYMSDVDIRGVGSTRIALAYRRKDVHRINQFIRTARQSAGDLTDEVLFTTDHGPRAFATGDRIVFTRNDKDLGVRNGLLGTVEAVEDQNILVKIDNDIGSITRHLTINTGHYSAIDHGYATTIHKSQGVTIDRSFVLSAGKMDRHLTYVAMSRHKHSVNLYVSDAMRKVTVQLEPRRATGQEYRR